MKHKTTPVDLPEAFPLKWPESVPRTKSYKRARAPFKHNRKALTVAQALERLLQQTNLLGARYVVVSTNLQLRLDGLPYSNQRTPEDTGVAVYFAKRETGLGRTADGLRWKSTGWKAYCFPCDAWDRVADNIAAVAKHLEAMRGQTRWGVGTAEQAYAGYTAALPSGGPEDWRVVFERFAGRAPETAQEAAELHRTVTAARHPDKPGGLSSVDMAALNEARDQARKELS